MCRSLTLCRLCRPPPFLAPCLTSPQAHRLSSSSAGLGGVSAGADQDFPTHDEYPDFGDAGMAGFDDEGRASFPSGTNDYATYSGPHDDERAAEVRATFPLHGCPCVRALPDPPPPTLVRCQAGLSLGAWRASQGKGSSPPDGASDVVGGSERGAGADGGEVRTSEWSARTAMVYEVLQDQVGGCGCDAPIYPLCMCVGVLGDHAA